MNKNLKNYLDKIEHLEYKKRLQIHSSLFENKAMISKFLWDIHSYNAKKFYKSKNNQCSSNLEIKGFITGKLSNTHTDLLRQIFKSCEKVQLDPFDFDFDYVYEPRKNLHDDMVRINNYFKPSKFFYENFPKILDPLEKVIEVENQFYWKVASFRIFEVKPVNKAQGFHKDDQALAIKKLFFYPEGANKEIGSTIIIDKDGNENIIDLQPGSWMMFENSLCEHQAFSSLKCSGRPTIEVDIMPDFISDTKLEYHGVNGWYPWFPIQNSNYSINGGLDYDEIFDRNLKRLSGLCMINKTDNYRFPCEFSDYYDPKKDIFEIKKTEEIERNPKKDMDALINKHGLANFLLVCLKYIPIKIFKGIIRRITWKE